MGVFFFPCGCWSLNRCNMCCPASSDLKQARQPTTYCKGRHGRTKDKNIYLQHVCASRSTPLAFSQASGWGRAAETSSIRWKRHIRHIFTYVPRVHSDVVTCTYACYPSFHNDLTCIVYVKTLVRWATGKRLTDRLPKVSLITLSPPSDQRGPWSSYGVVRA